MIMGLSLLLLTVKSSDTKSMGAKSNTTLQLAKEIEKRANERSRESSRHQLCTKRGNGTHSKEIPQT